MDYIGTLLKSEKEELCQIITGQRFKKLFRKKSNDFSRILRGFRADSLSEEQALSIGIANLEAPFIHTYVNQKTEYWLSEIERNIRNSISIGISKEKAMLLAIHNSAFHKNPSFYFRFTAPKQAESCIKIMEAALEIMDAPQEQAEDHSTDFIRKKDHLSQKSEWEKETDVLQEKIIMLQEKIEHLNSALTASEADAHTLSLENQALLEELSDYRRRAGRVTSVPAFIQKDGFPYASVCSVYRDHDGRCRLRRLADVQNGELLKSFCNDFPEYEYLFAKDGPDFEDFIGIWDWKTTPLDSDPSRDYILTSFNNLFSPIQVCVLDKCSTIEEVLQYLMTGIDDIFHADKVFFCFWESVSSRFTGILCARKELQTANGKNRLKDTVMTVPMYKIPYSDILQKQNLTFLRYLDPGLPEKVLAVKDELECVREIVLQQASWSAFKQKGLQHSDQRMVKDFLSELPVNDLLQELCHKCSCDTLHAQELIDQFQKQAETYLNSSDVSSDILAVIAQTHPDLFSACKVSILEDWNIEHTQMISEAQAQLDTIHRHTAAEKAEYDNIQKQYACVKEEFDAMVLKLSAREKLAQEVEEKVAKKIEAAKHNAADFIAEQAFCNAAIIASAPAVVDDMHLVPGRALDENNLEMSNSWQISMDIMESELGEAGISDRYVHEFSAFLMACCSNHVIPLLAGPYGHDIADACSAAMFGSTAIIIPDPDLITTTDLQKLSQKPASVVIIEKPFNAGAFRCVDRLRNCMVIAVNPYVEDLQIEPSGFVNYYFPVMTELFVDKVPTRHFLGGIPDKGYVQYSPCTPARVHSSLLKDFKLSHLAQNRIQQVLSDFHRILGQEDVNTDLLFSLLPLSFTLRKMDILFESSLKSTCSKDVQELLVQYWSDHQ